MKEYMQFMFNYTLSNCSLCLTIPCRTVVDWDSVRHCSDTHYFHVHTNMVKDVGILRLFPGITRATVSNGMLNATTYICSHVDQSISAATYAGSCIAELW